MDMDKELEQIIEMCNKVQKDTKPYEVLLILCKAYFEIKSIYKGFEETVFSEIFIRATSVIIEKQCGTKQTIEILTTFLEEINGKK